MTQSRHTCTIDSVYPWGRSLGEYVRMFALRDSDLRLRILGCADGPASFNAELTACGGRVTSCDPLYEFSADEIRARIEQTAEIQVDHARKNAHLFLWQTFWSPEHLRHRRFLAMETFLADFSAGIAAGRYLTKSLPNLEFSNGAFDLALCSHFLFLYSHLFSQEFHLHSILEMARVAREVRIYPLLDMEGRVSEHLQPVMDDLSRKNLEVAVEIVSYEFLRGANQMLRIGYSLD